MLTFNLKKRYQFNVEYQGVLVSDFEFFSDGCLETDIVFRHFLSSNEFTKYAITNGNDDVTSTPFLRCAFDLSKIAPDDFKKYSSAETLKLLYSFGDDPDWGEDKNDFAELLKQYSPIHSCLPNEFYYITKDWFSKEDIRLNQPESWCYIYYFLLVSIDNGSNTLSVSEWLYD